ncbi:MAG: C10 family peptidase [Alistipes sp.]|nr:C10 family peptidase [Alistipes sp.]
MKRLLIIAALAVVSICGAVAKEIPSTVALDIARGVLGDATRGTDVVVAWDSHALGTTRGGDAPTFYVITPTSGVGFVIVAGDDRVAPVLAYSTRYTIADEDMLPPNFAGWLVYVDDAVKYVRENDIAADEATARLWSELYVPTNATLLNTARWSQYQPYNKYCPLDDGALSLTGCTQTAMAIIMHYNRWPAEAQGTTVPFTTSTKGLDVPARDLNHKYDWDNMLYEYVEGEYSDAEGDAVAVLMADLGHSFQADYSAISTAAFPNNVAMYENYGYSPSCYIAMRDYYSAESWNALLRSEIDANRPIFYSAYTADEAGHAFVIDGYDANDYFHVNWGWGGMSDGFFKIEGLVLEEYVFDTMHWAFLGIHPVRDGEIDNWIYLSAPGMTTQTKEFETGVSFVIDGISIANPAVVNFDGEVRVGVCDIEGEFKSWASDAVAFSLDSGYATSVVNITAQVEDEILSGDRLRAFYRAKSGDKWHLMMPYADNTQWEIVLKHPSIGDTTSLKFDKTTGLMTITHDEDVIATLNMLGSVVESGVETTSRLLIIDTNILNHKDLYTIYLEHESSGESKSYTFTLNDL